MILDHFSFRELSSMLPIHEFLEFEYRAELFLDLPILRDVGLVDAWNMRALPWRP